MEDEPHLSDDVLLEALAEYTHEVWSEWMTYMFKQCQPAHEVMSNAVVIPHDAVVRWKRRMKSSYDDLSEERRALARQEAMRILEIMMARQSRHESRDLFVEPDGSAPNDAPRLYKHPEDRAP